VPKILGKVGVSLADQYDVEGSEAGVERLDSDDAKVVHDLTQTIFSERMVGRILQIVTPATAQNTNFNVTIGPADVSPTIPRGISRILGCFLFSDVNGAIDDAQISLRDSNTDLDMPIFVFDEGLDKAFLVRIDSGLDTVFTYRPAVILPSGAKSFLIGAGQGAGPNSMALRGSTSGFGAGNVVITARIYIAFAEIQGLSSYGVCVPSW